MNAKKYLSASALSFSMKRLAASAALVTSAVVMTAPAQAAFHLWNIREVYTDATGTNQFIEFFTAFGNQQFVGNHVIQIAPADGSSIRTFTIPANLPSDSANKAFMVGTVGITNFGAPKPDYVIPSFFLVAGGGAITFFGQNSGPYTNLSTNGILSRTWASGDATNSPQNFAGQVGKITLPAINAPPVISITSPVGGTGFTPPATVAVTVSATDDGSVASVRLLTNGVAAATNTVAPFGFTLTNLANGDYILRALAFDNLSLSATSAPVTIRVSDGPVLVFGRGTNGPIQFHFNSVTGINDVVERGVPLTNFSPVVTNPGSGGVIQFSETNNADAQRTYRVRQQ